MAELSGRMLGEFILCEQIAEGGHAVVYRGEQPLLKRDVVVKVLRTRRRRNDAAQERFLREAQLASRLDHPYAAHVYAFGAEDSGLLWIAMERVQGVTLSAWLQKHGPMPLEQLVPFFERVAEVVQAAHDSGIVHRDLKPSNVMVVQRGGRLLPKLLDFGIAKLEHEAVSGSGGPAEPVSAAIADGTTTERLRVALQREDHTRTDPNDYRLTRSGTRMGSAPYMSPEQWRNAGTVGPATDIYSLGILVYEALTGRRPFHAENTNEYYRLHLDAALPALGEDFPPELERVLRRATAKQPEARHASALELAAELGATLRAQPREQLRSLAQVWADRSRSPALLLKGGDLLRAPTGVAGDLERVFVAESRRHAARRARIRRMLAATAAVLGVCAVWYRGELKAELAEQQARLAKEQTRSAQRIAEVTITQGELEQGRSALLHGEPEALPHLAAAYRRDPAPSTAFMLARAMQPRLAEQARLASSFGRMWWAAFSPDGKQVVTCDDKNAQVWDAQTFRPRFTLPHGDIVYQAVYAADGASLVTAGGDGVIRIWDPATGGLVRALRRGRASARYYAVALSPDARLVVASALSTPASYVWDARTGALVAELPGEPSERPSLAFSADGRWLATAGDDKVHVFDARTWAHVGAIRDLAIRHLSWDPSGPRLLTGGAKGDVSLWMIPSLQRSHHLREIGESVGALAFSPDGRFVVVASHDGTEQVWDAASGSLRSQGNYLHSKILSVEFDRTSTWVAAASSSGLVAITDAALGMPVTILDGPRNVIRVARFDPSSRRVVGASWDGTARIWDASSPYRKWGAPPVSSDCGLVTSLEPDQRYLAIGCREHPTHVWDTGQDRLLAELPSVTPAGGDFASAYPAVSAQGDRAAIARGTHVEVYALPGGRLLRTIAQSAAVNSVAFAHAGNDILSGAVDGSLLITRDNGAQVALPTASAGIDAAGFLPDGRVVAVDARRRLRVYDPGGRAVADLETSARVRMLRMSPDSRRLITIPSFMSRAAAPQLWDLEHPRFIAPLAGPGGDGQVFSARFVAGSQPLTACADGIARLWDGTTGQLRHVYRGASRSLADATMSVDGSMIIAGDADGMLRFWDAGSERPLWTLRAHNSHIVGIRVAGDEVVTHGFFGDVSRWVLPRPERVIEACGTHKPCVVVQP